MVRPARLTVFQDSRSFHDIRFRVANRTSMGVVVQRAGDDFVVDGVGNADGSLVVAYQAQVLDELVVVRQAVNVDALAA